MEVRICRGRGGSGIQVCGRSLLCPFTAAEGSLCRCDFSRLDPPLKQAVTHTFLRRMRKASRSVAELFHCIFTFIYLEPIVLRDATGMLRSVSVRLCLKGGRSLLCASRLMYDFRRVKGVACCFGGVFRKLESGVPINELGKFVRIHDWNFALMKGRVNKDDATT